VLAPFAKREVWPPPKLDDSGAARISSAPPSPIGEARGIEGGVASASRSRRGWRPSRLGSIVGLSAAVIVGALVVVGFARQKQIAASHEADARAAEPSLASRERPPAPARPALTSNVVSPPVAPAGAAGPAAGHPARRHAARPPVPVSAASSAASSAAPVAPAAKPAAARVTFDRQNPYE
jgi:hypothetical protein